MMIHFEIVLPTSFEGGSNSDISIENIFIEQRRTHKARKKYYERQMEQ